MTRAPLVIPRRLAIALLAEAQKADGGRVHGWIGARDGVPAAVWPGDDAARMAGQGQSAWARYHSGTTPDAGADRQLLISIDTKGVLQLRCWEPGRDGSAERALAIVD